MKSSSFFDFFWLFWTFFGLCLSFFDFWTFGKSETLIWRRVTAGHKMWVEISPKSKSQKNWGEVQKNSKKVKKSQKNWSISSSLLYFLDFPSVFLTFGLWGYFDSHFMTSGALLQINISDFPKVQKSKKLRESLKKVQHSQKKSKKH